MWLLLGCGVWPSGLPAARGRGWGGAAAACKLSKEPAPAASSRRRGVGTTACRDRSHAASSAALRSPPPPLPPRGPSPHTVICVTDPNGAGGRGRALARLLLPLRLAKGIFLSSLAPYWCPSPPGGPGIGGRRTPEARRAE